MNVEVSLNAQVMGRLEIEPEESLPGPHAAV